MGACVGKPKGDQTKEFRPLVISGPSGTGKSTLVKRLMADHPDCFAFSVSHTTRKPREGEVEGKDYFFVSLDEMTKAIENGEFLEHAKFSGNHYGTSKKALNDVMKSGRICILDVEVVGVKSLKAADIKALYVFIKPPSLESLEERIRSRGSETEEAISKRLQSAQQAMEYAETPGSYDKIIVNDDLDAAYEQLSQALASEMEEVEKYRATLKP